MRIFLYEFVTGGGLLAPGEAGGFAASLVPEGRAMVEAVAADLARVDGIETSLVCDQRMPLAVSGCRMVRVGSAAEAGAAFDSLAVAADYTLLIAPEFDNLLADCCRRVERCGGRLLGPSLPLVLLASDKQRTAEHLSAAGIRAPAGMALAVGERLLPDFCYPAVVKPRDGAGSQNLLLISTPEAAARMGPLRFSARLERYCPGTPASVAVLCGPRRLFPLAPCRQELSVDGRFTYFGGSLPLDSELASRARRLALSAVASLCEPRGYLGVDLVLGPTESEDVVIEINPRVTTSYVGLRQATRANLAEALLRTVAGEPVELSFGGEALQFDAGGEVRRLQETAR